MSKPDQLTFKRTFTSEELRYWLHNLCGLVELFSTLKSSGCIWVRPHHSNRKMYCDHNGGVDFPVVEVLLVKITNVLQRILGFAEENVKRTRTVDFEKISRELADRGELMSREFPYSRLLCAY